MTQTSTVRTSLEPGVWGVVPTPFHAGTLEVDTESLRRLLAFYAGVGATGLTMLGVFGEAASLTAAERAGVLTVARDACALPVVVGVTARATAPAVEEAAAAASVLGGRLRAVMLQANSPAAPIVIDHLRRVHEATGAPVVLQDYPVASGVAIATDDILAVVDACPFVCAVKAEAPPTAVAIARMRAGTDAALFGGLGGQGLLDELAAGSDGAMTGFSFPEALVACVGAWRAGDATGARDALLPYLPLVNFEQQRGIALAVRKELFHRRGLTASAAVRPPALSFPAELSARVDEHLRDGLHASVSAPAPTGED